MGVRAESSRVNNQEREREEVAEPIRLQSSEHLHPLPTSYIEQLKRTTRPGPRMCIPKVSPTAGSLFVINLAKVSIKIPPPPASVLSKPTGGISQINLLRQFATMKCISGRGGLFQKSASPGPQAPICPVLTYFSIVSVFVAIVTMNNMHGSQHHHHQHNLGK